MGMVVNKNKIYILYTIANNMAVGCMPTCKALKFKGKADGKPDSVDFFSKGGRPFI